MLLCALQWPGRLSPTRSDPAPNVSRPEDPESCHTENSSYKRAERKLHTASILMDFLFMEEARSVGPFVFLCLCPRSAGGILSPPVFGQARSICSGWGTCFWNVPVASDPLVLLIDFSVAFVPL